MKKVRPWCGIPSDRGRLKNRNRTSMVWPTFGPRMAKEQNSTLRPVFKEAGHLVVGVVIAERLHAATAAR